MTGRPLSRRARYREQTRAEAKQIALRQLAEAGVSALSFSAVAKELGVTGPALYRYFAGRDDLLSELVADAYGDLAAAVEAAARQAGPGSPRDRLRALAAAYRNWALAQPHRYRLLFGTTAGSGHLAPERTIPAAHRTMVAILDALAEIAPASNPDTGRHAVLDRELEAWARRRPGPEVPGAVARLGVTCWTRLHGLLSLEIEGHFAPMGFDPALLYEAEVDGLLDSAG